MKIEKFWVVTKPGLVSELADVCFETDAKGLALQFRGGLEPDEIHAIYTVHDEADKEAKRILAAFKKYDEALKSERA